MKVTAKGEEASTITFPSADDDDLAALLRQRKGEPAPAPAGTIVGELIALKDGGRTPLITYAGQEHPGALAARATIDLQGVHVGQAVVLVFERGDPRRPIVIGVIRSDEQCGLPAQPGHVEVESDGERLIVSARTEIVLRCGQASITLKNDGEIALRGTRLSSHASGVNRIKGGSVQIN